MSLFGAKVPPAPAIKGALFGRAYDLTIAAIGQANPAHYGNVSNAAPLRVIFDIKKNDKPDPNPATIEVVNLNPANRAAIAPGHQVTLRAGYADRNELIFRGQVNLSETRREGPDIVLKLTCGDGVSALTQVRLDKPYPPGVTFATVFNDLTAALGVTTDTSPWAVTQGAIVDLPTRIWSRGYHVHGLVRTSLNTLLRTAGLDWHVQNGVLYVLPKGKTLAAAAVVVSSSTGMVGIPSKGKDGIVSFNCLLNPSITPGRLVQLISTTTSYGGFYKVKTTEIRGDSHGDTWNMQVECTRTKAVTSL